MVLDNKLQNAKRDAFADPHRRDVEHVPNKTSPDALRSRWERDFRMVLVQPPEEQTVKILWQDNGEGVVVIYGRDDEPIGDLPFNLDQEPTLIAYAVEPLLISEPAERDDRQQVPSDAAARAMEDPRRFLGGSTDRI